eukprot:8052574-Pyramimonas_sp.AAC.2
MSFPAHADLESPDWPPPPPQWGPPPPSPGGPKTLQEGIKRAKAELDCIDRALGYGARDPFQLTTTYYNTIYRGLYQQVGTTNPRVQ